MVNIVSKYIGVLAVAIILLFTQQSFASYAPMKCDNMNKAPMLSSGKSSHLTSKMTMHSHDSMSEDDKSSHENCKTCNSGDCICAELGNCFGSNISPSTQPTEQNHMLYADRGLRFNVLNEHPFSGVYLHLFKPPIRK